MHIKAIITSPTGRIQTVAEFTETTPSIWRTTEFRSPQSIDWQFTQPVELELIAMRKR